MKSYEYKALDGQGKKKNGSISNESEKQAREQLRAKGLTILEIREVGQKKENTSRFSIRLFRSKINSIDLMVFTRQLATLMGSGMPLEQSLRFMLDQSERKRMVSTITSLRSDITKGYSLAQSMRSASTQQFPIDYIATISAGEESGKLVEVFEKLADDIEHQTKAKQSLGSALIYPALLIVICLTIVVLLMIYVIPEVTRVFVDQNQELPKLTVVFIAISDFLRSYGIYMLWTLIIVAVVFAISLRNKNFRYKWDGLVLRMPLFGKLVVISNAIRWSRSLGILLASGVSSLQALHLACDGVYNTFLRDQLRKVAGQVREGSSLTQSLRDQKCLPPFFVHMISSGEGGGNLDNMLMRASDYYNQMMRMTIESSLKVFEPLLILVMGGLVLMIVLSVLLPIFQINQLII